MIQFSNGVSLVQNSSELPAVPSKIGRLYLDFETTSDDPTLDSLNPWHHCWPCGFGITWDDMPMAYYIPCSVEGYDNWLRHVLSVTSVWVNHNIKYDMHVCWNDGIHWPDDLQFCCTLSGSKLIDSDRQYKGGYSLDAVARDWLHEDIHPYEEALKPYLHKNKDYGQIPYDIIAPYGGQDVLTVRRLDKYIQHHMPATCQGVWQTECELIAVLWDVENYGMRVDPLQLKKTELIYMTQMMLLEEQLAGIVGRSFRPHTNEDCFDIFCTQYGLPVVGWTEQGEPSFSKHALANYIGNPNCPQYLLKGVMEYRELSTMLGFFVRPYQEMNIDGIMHPSYNPILRTGRMSCKWPNMQQLNKPAKTLVHPREGNAFLSSDYSQIEFRTIVHYIKDKYAIEAYNKNPDTDFHQFVADMCGIKRRPAKTVNFMVAFGGGKKKTISVLSANGDVIQSINEQLPEDLPEAHRKLLFRKLCEERGLSIFNKYHNEFPGIKATARKAGAAAAARGYVFNLYGRRRHLPKEVAHIAFNTINQSSAADIMKERMVACHKLIKRSPIKIVASVHDELLFEGPADLMEDPMTKNSIVACMEQPSVELRVPIRCSAGTSRKDWKEASSDEVASPIDWKTGPIWGPNFW